MNSANLNIRTDKDVKEQAEQIFAKLGLNMTRRSQGGAGLMKYDRAKLSADDDK